jgi:hypothetical protein
MIYKSINIIITHSLSLSPFLSLYFSLFLCLCLSLSLSLCLSLSRKGALPPFSYLVVYIARKYITDTYVVVGRFVKFFTLPNALIKSNRVYFSIEVNSLNSLFDKFFWLWGFSVRILLFSQIKLDLTTTLSHPPSWGKHPYTHSVTQSKKYVFK